ncbi:MAG: hypothetical protein MUO50_13560, partial [Longimicrobiales bacterium]|nr:hypothetical protein [Longimicrobiales bacterium]
MAESIPGNTVGMKRVAEIMIPLDRYPRVQIKDPLSHAVEVIENSELEVGRRRSLPRVLLVFDAI